jgi:hypothetical protein
MDFVTPDFGKAPRDDTTFNRKRMVFIESQSKVLFISANSHCVQYPIYILATICCWPK